MTLTAILPALADDGEHIDVALALGGHDLLRLDALQGGELVADLRGALELEPLGRLPPCAPAARVFTSSLRPSSTFTAAAMSWA